MPDYTIKRLGDMESILGGSFHKAGSELGLDAFGMNIIDLPAQLGERYPEHTHEHDGHEEVFVVLRGSGRIALDGEEHDLDSETVVRIGPAVRRKLYAGEDGMRVLALSGIPGGAYQRPEVFAKGAADPTKVPRDQRPAGGAKILRPD